MCIYISEFGQVVSGILKVWQQDISSLPFIKKYFLEHTLLLSVFLVLKNIAYGLQNCWMITTHNIPVWNCLPRIPAGVDDETYSIVLLYYKYEIVYHIHSDLSFGNFYKDILRIFWLFMLNFAWLFQFKSVIALSFNVNNKKDKTTPEYFGYFLFS